MHYETTNIIFFSPINIGPHDHNWLNAFRRLGQSQKFSNAKNLGNGPWDMTCNNMGTHLEILGEVVG